MSILALAAPTAIAGDPQLTAGLALGGTFGESIVANTGFTVQWVPGLMLYALGATSNTITLTFTAVATGFSNLVTSELTAATPYLFGPISNAYVNSSGLVAVTITGVVTGAYFAGLLPPLAAGALHNPFERNVQNADY